MASASVAGSHAIALGTAECPCQLGKRHRDHVRARVATVLPVVGSIAPEGQKTGTTSRGGLPTGPDKRTVDIVETQDSGPNVHHAHAVPTTSDGSVGQSSALIIHQVHVDGIATPLRALVGTGASNNVVRAKVVIGSDMPPPDATNEMVGRLANGSTVKMPKRAMRLAVVFEGFRGEEEFILLDFLESVISSWACRG